MVVDVTGLLAGLHSVAHAIQAGSLRRRRSDVRDSLVAGEKLPIVVQPAETVVEHVYQFGIGVVWETKNGRRR